MNKANQDSSFDPANPQLKNRVVILNGFEDQEIIEIMRQVKSLCRTGTPDEQAGIAAHRSELIFARTTPKSLQTTLGDLIIDMSEDHEYLKKNPPLQRGLPS